MSDAVNNPYKRDVPDKTLTRDGVPADAQATGNAIKGLIKKITITLRNVEIKVRGQGTVAYYYSSHVQLKSNLPSKATILAATPRDWDQSTVGLISVFVDTEKQFLVVMAANSGMVGTLVIDVIYTEEV